MSLKILLTAYCVSPLRGSEPGTAWRTAVALVEDGNEVVLLTSAQLAKEVENVSIPPNLRILRIDASPPHVLNRGRVGTYLRYWLWMRSASRAVDELLGKEHFDVAHHISWGSLPWGAPIDGQKIPMVFGPIGGGQKIPTEFLGEFGLRERLVQHGRAVAIGLSALNPKARAAARGSTVSLATNSASERLLRSAGSSHVVPFLADVTPPSLLDRETIDFEQRQDIVLWVGRLLPLKAPGLAIRVLALLPEEVRLVYVGDGPEVEATRSLAGALGVEERVSFLGHLPWDQLSAQFDLAKVLLFTSLRDSSGPQLLEAGARGLPIVAIGHHGAGEWVPAAAGNLVDPTTVSDTVTGLAEGILALLGDPTQWTEASVQARHFAQSHSAECHAKLLTEIYKDIAGSNAATGNL